MMPEMQPMIPTVNATTGCHAVAIEIIAEEPDIIVSPDAVESVC